MFCFVYNNYCNHPFYKLVGLDPGVDVKSLAAMSLALAAKSLAAMSLALAVTVVSLTPSLLRSSTA